MGGEKDFKMMRKISNAFRDAGYKTYLPVDDGFPLLLLFNYLEKSDWTDAKKAESKYYLNIAAYSLDVYSLLHSCNAVICNVNPFLNAKVNPDSGSVMEASLAYAYNRPISFFKSSKKRMLPKNSTKANGWDNPMIVGIANHFNLHPDYTSPTIPELIKAIESKMAQAGKLIEVGGSYQFPNAIPVKEMPVQIQNYIDLGEGIQNIKSKYDGEKMKKEIALNMVRNVSAYLKKNAEAKGLAKWNGYVPQPVH